MYVCVRACVHTVACLVVALSDRILSRYLGGLLGITGNISVLSL